MAVSRAPSGARFVGDDVQHMIVWHHALQTQVEGTDITELQVEAAAAGNLDDMAIIRDGRLPDEYWQIKASVDATSPLDEAYLTAKHYSNGDSILLRMYKSWQRLERRSDAETPKAVFATTKGILHTDPVLSQLSTDDGRLVYSLGRDHSARQRWADHLQITEEELNNFLQSFEIKPGLLPSHLKSLIRHTSQAAGLDHSDKVIAAGIQTVRDWVKGGKRNLSRQEIHQAIEKLDIKKPNKSGLLVVQMGGENPRASSTKYALDFVGLFEGTDSSSRRRLVDPASATKIVDGLVAMRQQLRADGIYDIEVDGPMRCPLWFLTGRVLSETSAVVVGAKASTGMWSSANVQSQPVELKPTVAPTAPGKSNEIALSVNLSLDIGDDVDDYLAASLPDTPHIKLSLDPPSTRAIKSPSHAQAIAIAVRLAARKYCREFGADKVHLFLGMPGQAALLMGHAWDRLPPTILYWDMGKPGTYSPAFTVG